MAGAPVFVEKKLQQKPVILFGKSYCPGTRRCDALMSTYKELTEDLYETVDLGKRSDCSEVEDYLWRLSGLNNRETPLLFVNKVCMGGYEKIIALHRSGNIKKIAQSLHLACDPNAPEMSIVKRLRLHVSLGPIFEDDVVIKVVTILPTHVEKTPLEELTDWLGIPEEERRVVDDEIWSRRVSESDTTDSGSGLEVFVSETCMKASTEVLEKRRSLGTAVSSHRKQ